jgi:hypothetical protein
VGEEPSAYDESDSSTHSGRELNAPTAKNASSIVWLAVAFFAGFLLAAVTSRGIVEERLSAGSPQVGLVVNGLVTFTSILTLAIAQRRAVHARGALVAQGVGAMTGIAAVHIALRVGWIPGTAWLVERPAQFVNDSVAVGATLAVVWACARGLRLWLLLGSLLVLTAYRVTGRFWHLDAPPQGFQTTVQDFVIAQFVGAALALGIYRGMTRDAH